MLHLEQLKDALEALCAFAEQSQRQFVDDIGLAQQWLAAAPPVEEVRARLAALDDAHVVWAGAWPVTDAALAARFSITPPAQLGATLVAVDGSQIFPDRHAAILYYLIQIGALVFRYDGTTPVPYQKVSLHFEDGEIYDEQGYIVSSTLVNQQRLLHEMTYLAELAALTRAKQSPVPCFTMTDGPLVWPYPERGKVSPAFEAYNEALTRARDAAAIPVGYVDRPGGRALLDLLWALQLPPEQLLDQARANPLQRLTDFRLMRVWLQPGERSAWFKRLTPVSRMHAARGHELWFCYLNVGQVGHPAIARVEVPVWAARDGAVMDTLHAAILHQARVLTGYPYVLARAHEEALVNMQDKAALDNIIQRRLMERGILARPSEKATQKAYMGKR